MELPTNLREHVRKKFYVSSCPVAGPVQFSFQLPPLNYFSPNRRTMFMPYQLHHLLRANFTCPLDNQTSIFTCPRAKFTCPRQSDLPCHVTNRVSSRSTGLTTREGSGFSLRKYLPVLVKGANTFSKPPRI